MEEKKPGETANGAAVQNQQETQASTAPLTAREISPPAPPQTPTKAPPEEGGEINPTGGFGAFRDWANSKLSDGRKVLILHNSEACQVEELTPYGELRLKVDESFALVPFAGRDIAEFLRQIL